MPKISAATVAEHTARTREVLLDAIEGLVLERPFASISMRDIAERASVSRTAIYNYAPDTISLLIEATNRGSAQIRAVVAEQAERADASPRERLRGIVTVLLLEHARSTSTMLTLLDMERHTTSPQLAEALVFFRTQIGATIMGVVSQGAAVGEFAPVERPLLTLAFMVGVMQSAVHKIVDASTAARADVAEAAASFLLKALSASPEPLSASPDPASASPDPESA